MAVDVTPVDALDSGAIIANAPGYLAILSAKGEVEAVSCELLSYSGLSLDALRQRRAIGVVHDDDAAHAAQFFEGAAKSAEAHQYDQRLRRSDGEYRWFHHRAAPIGSAQGLITHWLLVLTDIEGQKRAEAALRVSEEKLRDVIETSEAFLTHGEAVSGTGSFLWRVESEDMRWSNQLYRIFEFSPGTPISFKRIGSRVHPEDLFIIEDMMARASESRGLRYDARLLMPDGRVKHLHLAGRATVNPAGGVEYIGTVQDVTERRLAEQALSKVRSDLAHFARVTSLNTLTASIAHEVNQPLTGIITNAGASLRMLAADPPNIEGAQEAARRTIRDGNRASEVIKRLRSMFQKREVSSEPVDLNDASREVIQLSLSELQRNGVILKQEWADDLPSVTGDRVQLQQVILNLLLNACDAMADVTDRPRVLVVQTELNDAGQITLTVNDSGIGLGSVSSDGIFEAFHTTKPNGMGIGLSVSRSIAESHGGRLEARSNEGFGASFSLSLPVGGPPRS